MLRDKRNAPQPLSKSIKAQLAMYATAASAAGVALTAMSPLAEGKIVYKSANIQILPENGYALDFNRDGITDLGLSNTFFLTSFISYANLWAAGGGAGDQVLVSSRGCAAGLIPGQKVGPNGKFGGSHFAYDMAHFYSSNFRKRANVQTQCPWAIQKPRYLGVKFLIKGKTHYGWVRVKVTWQQFSGMTGYITGYAYETIPNKGIIANKKKGPLQSPEPSLGHLAKGALTRSLP
jgi:hypothetical protein